jgi:hypothetical protein
MSLHFACLPQPETASAAIGTTGDKGGSFLLFQPEDVECRSPMAFQKFQNTRTPWWWLMWKNGKSVQLDA